MPAADRAAPSLGPSQPGEPIRRILERTAVRAPAPHELGRARIVHRRWATVDAQTNVVSGCERRMKIADCMTRDVITLSPEESCLRARTVMEAAGVKRLPILEDGRLVGIVTDGDLLRRVPHAPDCRDPRGSQEELLPHVKVGGVMTYAPLTASATMPIDEAAALMRKHRINTLPVVGEGMRLVGILTMEDVLRACQMPSRSR